MVCRHASLLQGIDCPMTAAFMDAVVFYGGGGPTTYKNAICVFEHNPSKSECAVCRRQKTPDSLG